MGSCVKHITDPKKMVEEIKGNAQTVATYHWKQCPHCHNTLKQMESECQKMGKNSPVRFVACEVEDNPFCKEMWQAARPQNVSPEEYGVPVVVGLSPNKSPAQPNWQIVGEKAEEIQAVMKNLREAVQRYDSTGSDDGDEGEEMDEEGGQPMPPPQAPPTGRPTYYQRMAPLYNWMAKTVAESPMVQQIKMKSAPSYRQINDPLCIPPNCDKKTAQRRLYNFLLS